MKTLIQRMIAASLCCGAWASAQSSDYINFIRQVQFPGGIEYDAGVASSGSDESKLAIDPGGARFELWTKNTVTLEEYLLSSTYVGTYIPVATVAVRSEDNTSTIPRTRADRPFWVDVTVSDLLSPGDGIPDAATQVTFLHHVQSYGVGGTGVGIDRTQATLLSQATINTNGTQNLTFQITSVPGGDRSKVRGEERFSIFSLPDNRDTYSVPASQIASQYIQIWPVADGSITGISQGQYIRYKLPQLTITANDLYPSSTTYAQVYKGDPSLGVVGKIVPGSAVTISDAVPQNKVLVIDNYGDVFDADGRWTMELVTVTPFGTDRLAYVSFDLDRTIKVNGSFVTIK